MLFFSAPSSTHRGVGVIAVDVVLVGEGAGHAVGAAAGAAGAAVTPHVAHAAAELVDDLHALAVAAAAPRARVVAEARRVADLVERRAVHATPANEGFIYTRERRGWP